MFIKNPLIILVTLLILTSCGSDKQSFTLSGKFKGLEQGEFICFSEAPEWGTLDTIRVQGGKFTITHPLTDTVVITLQYPNFMQTQVIAIPGEEVTLRGDANNMLSIDVGSDDANETLSDFRKSIVDLKPSERTAAAEKFIASHPDSWASIAIFSRYILQAEQPDYAKMEKLLGEMEKSCPTRQALLTLRSQMRGLLAGRTGKKLPPFTAITLKGDTVSNATFSGKPLLITFWSTMVPDHTYLLVATYRILRNKFQISTLNICLDADTAFCRRTLRKDSIGGYNVCDLHTFDSPLVKTLGLRRLPSNILIDSQGIVRERDIPVNKVEATLRRYL